MAESHLTLVLPPLILADTEAEQFASSLAQAQGSLPGLRKAISRGDRERFSNQSVALCHLFGFDFDNLHDIPVATLRASGNGFDSSTGYWLCADPVHLHPDLDHVVLFDKQHFKLSANELSHLVEGIKELLVDSGIETWIGHDLSLYFRLEDIPAVNFTPLSEVVGKNILPYLPEGEDAAKWTLLSNEIQMQLTQNKVNEQREHEGEVAINGLWFWGGGFLLPKRYDRQFDTVMSDDVFIKGLANFRDISLASTQKHFSDIALERKTLVCAGTNSESPEEYLKTLLEVEQNWLSPALAALKKKQLGSLTLFSGNMRISLNRKSLGRFWKRTPTAKELLAWL